jgi:hypothetical protein
MEKKTNKSLGIAGIIFLIFLILKLSDAGVVANWSWRWVTSPLWIPFCVAFTIEFFSRLFNK